MCQKPAMMLHRAMPSWSEHSSIKAEPEINQCLRLAREFLKDGFLTSSDPLLIQVGESMDPGMWQQWKWGNDGNTEGAILPQSIGYLKGAARSSTLLALWSIILEDGNIAVHTV